WGDVWPHQVECAASQGSICLAAPTGSGKTESALLWAAAQSAHCPATRLFYVLPYQASLNAMHDRLAPQFGPGDVALQHSKALYALYHRYLDRDQTAGRAAWAARAAR